MAESQGPLVTTVAITFAVLTFITLCLRFWARLLLVKFVAADDYECCYCSATGITPINMFTRAHLRRCGAFTFSFF